MRSAPYLSLTVLRDGRAVAFAVLPIEELALEDTI